MARTRPRRPRAPAGLPLLEIPFRQPRPLHPPYNWLNVDELERLHDASLLIMPAAGWLDGGLTVSFEKFVLDLENLAMFGHFLNGFAIDDDALALDAIAAVGPSGHHLGTDHTQARYRTAFFPTTLADRQGHMAHQPVEGGYRRVGPRR